MGAREEMMQQEIRRRQWFLQISTAVQVLFFIPDMEAMFHGVHQDFRTPM